MGDSFGVARSSSIGSIESGGVEGASGGVIDVAGGGIKRHKKWSSKQNCGSLRNFTRPP